MNMWGKLLPQDVGSFATAMAPALSFIRLSRHSADGDMTFCQTKTGTVLVYSRFDLEFAKIQTRGVTYHRLSSIIHSGGGTSGFISQPYPGDTHN